MKILSGLGVIAHRELTRITIVPIRTKYYNNRHRDPKYRLERSRKVWKVNLPDFDQARIDQKIQSPEEVRTKLKEKGVAPTMPWDEREMFLPCTMTTIEPYQPTDGDGKSSSLIDKVKSPFSSTKSLFVHRKQLGELRNFEGDEFDLKEFAKQSVDIYAKAHEALAAKDEEKIFDYVTEHCFPLMSAGLNRHTINWKYLGEVEPPVVVQVRSGDQLSKGNKYCQITVRMYSKQILSVHDRHGRLVQGSPTDVKEVLEYIVFEKYLANEYGLWRVHDRIRPQSTSQSMYNNLISKTVRL